MRHPSRAFSLCGLLTLVDGLLLLAGCANFRRLGEGLKFVDKTSVVTARVTNAPPRHELYGLVVEWDQENHFDSTFFIAFLIGLSTTLFSSTAPLPWVFVRLMVSGLFAAVVLSASHRFQLTARTTCSKIRSVHHVLLNELFAFQFPRSILPA